ncbi:MOSC domain-containing protein [Diaphorobacter aerolatus]|uniref:MOSC domain-containing protein n=1 Tax=Diaphorobacter aerolatus TaxID=1288495 RepID=UPI0021F7C7EC|nr:MOSC domain-containing protein [Diaphorobacter aerolatus]
MHCYAWEHYARWREALPGNALWDAPGAFGENLSVEGLREQDVCIGDRWQIGSAQFLVSQGRQPCFKLNLRFGVRDMSARVQDSLMAGWYLQVVQAGAVRAGDALELLARPHPEYSVARLLEMIRDRLTDETALREVLELPLTPSWRKLFEARMKTARVEDWSRRMQGGGH